MSSTNRGAPCDSTQPIRYTLGDLIQDLTRSEEVFAAQMKDAERLHSKHGWLVARHMETGASHLRWRPDATRMPGINRIELICDDRFGTGVTLEAVQKLRAELGRTHQVELDSANSLTLTEAADLLGIEGGISGQRLVGPDQTTNSPHPIRVLYVAACRDDRDRRRLDAEARSIHDALRQGDYGASFEFAPVSVTTVTDLQCCLLRHRPHIVHFTGHGDSAGRLVLEHANGIAQIVPASILEQLFQLFTDDIEVVVLNTCHSHQQAEAIVKHVDFVVGMSDAIDDDAGIAFSTSFYGALACGKTPKMAFDLASNEIAQRGIAEDDKPTLLAKAGIELGTAIFSAMRGKGNG